MEKLCPICEEAHERKSVYCSQACRRLSRLEQERAAVRVSNARRYKNDPEFRKKNAQHQAAWTARVRERVGTKGDDGFRSSMEQRMAPRLLAAGATYESRRFLYHMKPRGYKPDFILSNGIAVEVKGWFPAKDRTKLLAVKAEHPELDLRLVLASPRQRLGPKSKTTQAEWCVQHGFPWAEADVPEEWLAERATSERMQAVSRGVPKGVTKRRSKLDKLLYGE